MTETDKTALERERFDAWWSARISPPDPSPFPRHFAWEAWQARAAIDTGAVAVDFGTAELMWASIEAARAKHHQIPPDEDPDRCPICAEPIRSGDLCSTDIEMGTCHAACLEGTPIVDLETGEPSDGPVTTFIWGGDQLPAHAVVEMATSAETGKRPEGLDDFACAAWYAATSADLEGLDIEEKYTVVAKAVLDAHAKTLAAPPPPASASAIA